MYEIEAKAPLSPSKFIELKKNFNKKAVYKGRSLKSDTYFGNTKQEQIRLRTQGEKTFFHLKLRSVKASIEENIEMEWKVKNEKKLYSLLKKIELKPEVKKVKKTYLYEWKNFSLELNEIEGLGYFLEVEKVVKNKTDIPLTHKALLSLFKKLGFKKDDFEKRPYLQLLKQRI